MQALQDLDAASKLLPDNELIKDDLEGLREVRREAEDQAVEGGEEPMKMGPAISTYNVDCESRLLLSIRT